MKKDIVAGVDSSTQSCKVILRHIETGEILALARAPHPPTTPPCSEQDPQAWWNALVAALNELKSWWPRIAGISVGAQGHGLVMLDEHDQPLRPAKLWNDTESEPQAKKLREALPAATWAQLTGSVPGPAMTISKLAWAEENCPGLLSRCRRIMLPFDYLTYRLCGNAVTERGGATGTGYFNPFKNCWEPQLAHLVSDKLDWEKLWPKIVPSNSNVGTVIPETGLDELVGAVVCVGTGDNMSAALGMNIQPGDTAISIGTSGTLYGISIRGVIDETGMISGYADAADRFLPMITTLNSAKVTDTFCKLLRISNDEFAELALSAPAGANGLLLIPWLDGERTPNLPNATGELYGLRTTTDAKDIARAVIEGVLCGLLSGGKLLQHHGVDASGRLVITGGGGKSKAYCQILADLTGKSIWVSPIGETAAAGAAVQAAAAINGINNAEMAQRWNVDYEKVADPKQNGKFVFERYYSFVTNLLKEKK